MQRYKQKGLQNTVKYSSIFMAKYLTLQNGHPRKDRRTSTLLNQEYFKTLSEGHQGWAADPNSEIEAGKANKNC